MLLFQYLALGDGASGAPSTDINRGSPDQGWVMA
jgi:hypothetical protein